MKTFLDYFITYPGVYSVFLPIIFGIYHLKKLSPASKALLYFLLLSASTDLFISALIDSRIDTGWLLHFYTSAELIAVSFFFYRVYSFKSKGKLIILTNIVFTALSVINTVFFQPLSVMNSYTRALEALIIIGFCLIYLDQESKIRQTIRWEKKPLNWLVTGLLVYFAGAFFFFLFINVISTLSLLTQLFIWALHALFQIIMFILITIGYLNERGK